MILSKFIIVGFIFIFMMVALVALLRWRRLRMMMNKDIHYIPANCFIEDVLQPGDIVYMASRRLEYHKFSDFYNLVATNYMGTSFYHAFIVMPERRFIHAVHPHYAGKGTQMSNMCKDIYGDLIDTYVRYMQHKEPIYCVYRRDPPMTIDLNNSELCRRRFATYFEIGLHYLCPACNVETMNDRLHCNSYIGFLMQHAGMIDPVPNGLENAEYTPDRMQNIYLPRAGYHPIGYFSLV